MDWINVITGKKKTLKCCEVQSNMNPVTGHSCNQKKCLLGRVSIWERLNYAVSVCHGDYDFLWVSVYARGPFVHFQCELFLISLTAPDECCPQIKKFKMKQTMETNPGYKVAVWGTKHNKKWNTM